MKGAWPVIRSRVQSSEMGAAVNKERFPHTVRAGGRQGMPQNRTMRTRAQRHPGHHPGRRQMTTDGFAYRHKQCTTDQETTVAEGGG